MLFIAITSGMVRMCRRNTVANRRRTAIRSGRFMVPTYGATKCDASEIRGWNGYISNIDMRRMDICYIYR